MSETKWELNPELRELVELGQGEAVVDILRVFLEDAEEQIRRAEEAMRVCDGDGLKFAAHNLSGSAASIGFNDFSAVARHVAESYRRRMERDTQWLRDYMPMWLVLLVGMVVVLAFGLTLYLPFSQLMQALGDTFNPSIRIR